MRYRVLCEEDLMQVLDELNQGHDALVISQTSEETLNAKIAEWASTYKISITKAQRELREYFAEM